jgi:hypothetical protein
MPAVTTPASAHVALPEGPVTLEPLEQLDAQREAVEQRIREAEARADELKTTARARLVEAGTILAAQRSGWDTTSVAPELASLDAATAQINQLDTQLAAVANRHHQGLSVLFAGFGDRREHTRLVAARTSAAANLPALLEAIGQKAPTSTVPEADAATAAARESLAAADAIRQSVEADRATAAAMQEEITRRRAAVKLLGFDALWTAAWLQQNEPPAIDSPVTTKKGERAWLTVPSSLARLATRTQWVGGSQGVSFPIGHTGIRYRVGSFRGHPVEATSITTVDTGDLVLTNQRLVFIGSVRSVTILLSHVVHVEAYTDALAVFQDRREKPDFFKLQSPQYVLFYVNYALSRAAA